jgi:hypothetical protein
MLLVRIRIEQKKPARIQAKQPFEWWIARNMANSKAGTALTMLPAYCIDSEHNYLRNPKLISTGGFSFLFFAVIIWEIFFTCSANDV